MDTFKLIFAIMALILSLLSIGLSLRSMWIFKTRAKLFSDKGYHCVHDEYLDYDGMMKRFWVWDIEKLRKPISMRDGYIST